MRRTREGAASGAEPPAARRDPVDPAAVDSTEPEPGIAPAHLDVADRDVPLEIDQLPGMGPKILARVVRAFGSEEAFREACRAGEVDRLADISGIGANRAVELVHAVRGTQAPSLFGTPRVAELFEQVRDQIVNRAVTRSAQNRLRLLAPLADATQRADRLRWAEETRRFAAANDVGAMRRHLRHLRPLPPLEPAFESGIVVFVDDPDDQETLLEAGVDRYATIAAARDRDAAEAAECGIYAYREGDPALLEAPHIHAVPFTTDLASVVPWAILERYRKARPTLEAVAALAALDGAPSAAAEALEALAGLPPTTEGPDAATLEMEATEALAVALKEADQALSGITLTAADLVKAMNATPPAAVRQVYDEAVRRARRLLVERIGFEVDPYTDDLPPKVDPQAVSAAVDEVRRMGARERLERQQAAAVRLDRLTQDIAAEIASWERADADQALGSFILDHGLTAPEWGPGLKLEGALHLDHSPAGERVDHRVGTTADGAPDPERLVLLTGANSGGKTTLLETIAQVVALAHAGLPVPARRAIVPEVDAIHFYAERRSLGAGAFESFLKRFFPLATAPGRILVLADELEAMTELEAAAEILAAFLERLASREAWGVLATHMAPHILPAVAPEAARRIRVDGIEARGLDAEGRLIVDRSPRIGVRARSTPELILRRLAQAGPVDLRDLFEGLANRVHRPIEDEDVSSG